MQQVSNSTRTLTVVFFVITGADTGRVLCCLRLQALIMYGSICFQF